MDDNTKAIEALRELASYKLKESGVVDRVEKQAKLKMNQLGIDPESAAKSAALMKIIHDASQGRVSHDFGDFEIEGKAAPEERRLRFGWKKDF